MAVLVVTLVVVVWLGVASQGTAVALGALLSGAVLVLIILAHEHVRQSDRLIEQHERLLDALRSRLDEPAVSADAQTTVGTTPDATPEAATMGSVAASDLQLEMIPYLTDVQPGKQRRAAVRLRNHGPRTATIQSLSLATDDPLSAEFDGRHPTFALVRGETCLVWIDSFRDRLQPGQEPTGRLAIEFSDSAGEHERTWEVELTEVGSVARADLADADESRDG